MVGLSRHAVAELGKVSHPGLMPAAWAHGRGYFPASLAVRLPFHWVQAEGKWAEGVGAPPGLVLKAPCRILSAPVPLPSGPQGSYVKAVASKV